MRYLKIIAIPVAMLILGAFGGYRIGKHAADRYYAYYQNTWPENWREHSVTGMTFEGDCDWTTAAYDPDSPPTYWYGDTFKDNNGKGKPCRIYPTPYVPMHR